MRSDRTGSSGPAASLRGAADTGRAGPAVAAAWAWRGFLAAAAVEAGWLVLLAWIALAA